MAKQLDVIISTKEERAGRPPARSLVKNAWVYWWVGNSELLLRANETGRIVAFTSGPPDHKESYQTPFVIGEGTIVDAAFSLEDTPLLRGEVEPQLETRTVAESLPASLAAIGSVSVPGNGRTTVTVRPLAEIKLGPAIQALKGDEISLISQYPAPFDGNLAAEIKAAQNKTWHPGTVAFRAVANTPNVGKSRTSLIGVANFDSMLGAIQSRPQNSIRRLNLFAHANPGLIGLSGRMEGTTISMGLPALNDKNQPTGGGIDSEAVAFLNFDDTGKRIRDDLRTRFIKQGELLLFLCNGGLGRGLSLGQDLAQAFNIRVLAYNDPVGYYVDFPRGGRADRNLTSRGLLDVDEAGFAAARAAGTIAPGYPFAVAAPATVPQGLHLKPDKIVPKPKRPFA